MSTTLTTPLPTGRQHVLELGAQRAVVTAVGASLREYVVDGRDVVLPFDETEIPPAFSGAVLAPWPNRLRDGTYGYEGTTYEVPLTEPSRQTALHGLVAHTTFETLSADATTVVLEHVVVPTHGYPWPVRLQVTYELTAGGLRVTAEATNLGTTTAPYGIGFHPWLSPGDGSVDDCTLQVDAARHVTIDDRMLPTGTERVSGDYDLRSPRPLAGLDLDDAWIDLDRDADGLSWIRLGGSDGRTVAMWADGAARAWQVCTGDTVALIQRRGVAAEPMTCIADAFRTGNDLVQLAPGATHVITWGLTLV
ncbi:aldose 1-epimerase family protein [Cellulomonas fengjieae]|uniref:aldose 1-epimerase family protein n=1 Tax=Cellulomonas fengjieae TaxID=2819978 RepID=UPI001AAF21B9|nr:aldose 1-epimerase family protein [Cellulomonas fengjieae]MBO3103745.1 aldose 1-epimerase family protein [Cellulomonas fengjieae]